VNDEFYSRFLILDNVLRDEEVVPRRNQICSHKENFVFCFFSLLELNLVRRLISHFLRDRELLVDQHVEISHLVFLLSSKKQNFFYLFSKKYDNVLLARR